MDLVEFLKYVDSGKIIKSDSEMHKFCSQLSQEAIKITTELNSTYHTPEEIVQIFRKLTSREIPDSFRLFPPFNTDCGKNLHIGENVFVNAGCKFQDQGGIYIGDNTLIGHNVVLATLNHDSAPRNRGDLIPKPIRIGRNVWIGSNATICPGVSVGDNSIIAAGAVVTKNVDKNTVVGGVPAKKLKEITEQ